MEQNDGARPIKNLIKSEIENPIAKILLRQENDFNQQKITIYLSQGKVKVK